MIREINNYDRLVAFLTKVPETQLVVVDCYATWCGPCKNIAPFVDQLNEEYENVIFIKTNVEKAEETADEFEIKAMPTFIFIKNLTAIDKLESGSQTSLRKLVEKYQ